MTKKQGGFLAVIVVLVIVLAYDTYETNHAKPAQDQKSVNQSGDTLKPVLKSDTTQSVKERTSKLGSKSDTSVKSGGTTLVNPSATTNEKTLTIYSSVYPIQIIEGSNYAFPKDLESYGVQLTINASGYSIKDTMNKNGGNYTVIGSDNNIVSVNSVMSDGDITITEGSVYINGKKVNPGQSSDTYRRLENKTLVIQVPKSSSLKLNTRGQFTLTSNATFGKVWIDLSGQSSVKLATTGRVEKLELSGQSKLTITQSESVADVDISGQSRVEIGSVSSVGYVEVSGQSRLELPKNTVLTGEDISGQSSLRRR